MVYPGVEPKQPKGNKEYEAELNPKRWRSWTLSATNRNILELRNLRFYLTNGNRELGTPHLRTDPNNGGITHKDIAAYYGQAHGNVRVRGPRNTVDAAIWNDSAIRTVGPTRRKWETRRQCYSDSRPVAV